MKMISRILCALVLCGALSAFVGCKKEEGSFEQMGREVDKAAKETEKAVKEGAAKAEDAAKDAAKKAEEATK